MKKLVVILLTIMILSFVITGVLIGVQLQNIDQIKEIIIKEGWIWKEKDYTNQVQTEKLMEYVEE